MRRPLACTGLHPCIASVLQLAVLYLMGLVMTLCAYLGYSVTAIILEVRVLSSTFPPDTSLHKAFDTLDFCSASLANLHLMLCPALLF